jgi:Domain of unknown function (DUF3303)
MYLLTWSSKNPQESIARFLKHGHALPHGLKVLTSVHVVGQPKGYVLIEGPADQVQQVILQWSDTVNCVVETVLTDEQAKAALTAK